MKNLSLYLPTDNPILVVTSNGWLQRGLPSKLTKILGDRKLIYSHPICTNPQIEDLDMMIDTVRSAQPKAIIAVGGGSVIDAGKAIAGCVALIVKRPLHDIFRSGASYSSRSSLPLIAIPTTTGTGAEMTPFATVWDSRYGKKYSLSGEHLYPRAAILDSALLDSLPQKTMLHTALDATSHALESIWNRNCTPISKAYAIQALTMIRDNLPLALSVKEAPEARANLQIASALSGVAISITKTAIAHSISYPLTIHYQVPHGLAASFTLPSLIAKQLKVEQDSHTKNVFKDIRKLLNTLDLPTKLSHYVSGNDVLELKQEMYNPERSVNYCNDVNDKFLSDILRKSVSLALS